MSIWLLTLITSEAAQKRSLNYEQYIEYTEWEYGGGFLLAGGK